jgi:hypothetical protein
MGILTKLTTDGSPYSIANGGPISTNPLATNSSTLHADGTLPGYSLDGSGVVTVNGQYQAYVDGTPNNLPAPTTLDLPGAPSKYLDNLPG